MLRGDKGHARLEARRLGEPSPERGRLPDPRPYGEKACEIRRPGEALWRHDTQTAAVADSPGLSMSVLSLMLSSGHRPSGGGAGYEARRPGDEAAAPGAVVRETSEATAESAEDAPGSLAELFRSKPSVSLGPRDRNRVYPCPAGCPRTFTHAPAAVHHGKSCKFGGPRPPGAPTHPERRPPAAPGAVVRETSEATAESADGAPAWTAAEDAELAAKVAEFGHLDGSTKRTLDVGNWETVAKHMSTARTAKQLRYRWHAHVDPAAKKGPWTIPEVRTVIVEHSLRGNRWAEISLKVPGRPDGKIEGAWRCYWRPKLEAFLASRASGPPRRPALTGGRPRRRRAAARCRDRFRPAPPRPRRPAPWPAAAAAPLIYDVDGYAVVDHARADGLAEPRPRLAIATYVVDDAESPLHGQLAVVATEDLPAGAEAPYGGVVGPAATLATACDLGPLEQVGYWRWLIYREEDETVLLPFVDELRNPACFINDARGPKRRGGGAPNVAFLERGAATVVVAARPIAAGDVVSLLDAHRDWAADAASLEERTVPRDQLHALRLRFGETRRSKRRAAAELIYEELEAEGPQHLPRKHPPRRPSPPPARVVDPRPSRAPPVYDDSAETRRGCDDCKARLVQWLRGKGVDAATVARADAEVTVRATRRRIGSRSAKKYDYYYFHDDGRRVRSRPEVAAHFFGMILGP
ncbi:RNA polymerase II transcription regulator recruiting protein [Aureococcus anophagefferens]|nr:RNA polymerase II transcription regulator recruiting protein [Aureococcus anophagefferens]